MNIHNDNLKYSSIEGRIRQTIGKITNEGAIYMIDELMYFILHEQMRGKLRPDHRFFDLYLQLQLLREQIQRETEDMKVSVENDEVRT